MTLAETAYAKVNLALHVRGRRADGYHDIETIFAFADFGDTLTAALAEGITLTIGGRFGAGLPADRTNLVIRAAAALARRHDVKSGAAIHLEKALPVASGIGGGSADAAATLRLLTRLWQIDASDDVLREIAAELGADVPACLASRTARGEGVGERLQSLGNDLAGTPILLVNPLEPLSTAAVFKTWDGIDRGALPDLLPLAAARAGRNDLEPSAIALCPAVPRILETLHVQRGVEIVRMSGSGATCFALFTDEEAAAEAEAALAASSGWWTARGKLR